MGRKDLTSEQLYERRLFIMEQRRDHLTYEAIAQKVTEKFGYPISAVQCFEDFRLIMAQRAKQLNDATDECREIAIQQLDSVCLAILPQVKAGSLEAIDRYLKIQQRKAKLLGLDAPVQHEDVTKAPRLTVDEIMHRMKEISEKIARAKELQAYEPPAALEGEVATSEPVESQ
jgi:hypothetical protein